MEYIYIFLQRYHKAGSLLNHKHMHFQYLVESDIREVNGRKDNKIE